MGVMSTYCQICGLPVQQDHYVPAPGGGSFRIWRGDGDDEGGPAVAFGPEHGWLRDAVGLRLRAGDGDVVIEGAVHDGVFEDSGSDGFVGDGLDDRAALHRACWDLAGRPDTFEPLADLEWPEAEERYRQQLFEFAGFVADGHGWMLVDPATGSPDALRNRRRIADLLA
nr:hypothetical protein GCM10020063_045580 [Dactylosporangium thailandense]